MAPDRSSRDLNPRGVDSVSLPKNTLPFTDSVQEFTRVPHISAQDPNSRGVFDSVCASKNMSPSIASLVEYIAENSPRDSAGEGENWIAAGEESYNWYKAESAVVTRDGFTEWKIPSQLDSQVRPASPYVWKEPDQMLFQADDQWLDNAYFRRLQEGWLREDNQTRDILSGSYYTNTESIGASRSHFKEDHAGERIPAYSVEMQGLGQNDSPTIFQCHAAPLQLQHELHLDCTSNPRLGSDQPVDMQLDYRIYGNIVPSGEILADRVSVQSRSVQPLPELRDAKFRLEGEKQMPVVPVVANHTVRDRAISGPAPVPVMTLDCTKNSTSTSRIPIFPVQIYPEHILCSHPASPQFNLANLKDTTEVPTLETEQLAESGRTPGNLSYHSIQLFPWSATKELLTIVAGSGPDSNSARWSEERTRRSSKKRPRTETLPVVPDVYQEPLIPILGREYEDPFFKEKIQICNSMLGLERIRHIDGLEKSVNHILSIHQRCRKERKPFHIHIICASMEDTTAPDCCWLKQFGSINPDDTRIMRSFQQMCTRVVNSAGRNCPPRCRINRFPDWVNDEFKAFLKLHPKGISNSLKEIKEVEKFAESLGLEYSQVIHKMEHLRYKVTEDKKLQEKGESPHSTGNSSREFLDEISGRNLGALPLLPQTATYQNVDRRVSSRPQVRMADGGSSRPPSRRRRTRRIQAVYRNAD